MFIVYTLPEKVKLFITIEIEMSALLLKERISLVTQNFHYQL